ncbi:VasL domain-containing protein [Xenorhabdus griffiniae]|uniref:VasL domain-containing protein n=1 Tax=Xenorhabdus griffiniae TaxID=351672 RepID=A0ABY9XIQ9_9GAMM|nr:VasL domain-containing protein [Xenorhabdus griffiniae]MBD1227305.1 type VI secretion system ImpA family N-terminal domain-containing protein [Xenorhabdus griffiniae]MBE8586696.1 type VI secretion system ImpA family N-terminal domain-containing protein [Xenorhabdus griffiniae]WMV72716.1 VasL domain-containing protein [Xenorhabdus griffiniae]WNH02394.1 VasL domain-containing protein [Xenorhabdus griffiniae]
MSEQPENLIIRAGGSPLNLPEFAVIRDEINKTSHPAQPEVNWPLVESLSLTLFKTNGVDLQTAIYYTLARMQLNGLSGFTEGCELLAGVIVSEWDTLWPAQPQVRTDLLEWFHARTGSVLRQWDFAASDLRMIYRAERALQLIIDRLQQSDLKRLPRVENLLWFFQNAAKKLEKPRQAAKPVSQPVQMPPLVYLSQSDAEPETPPPPLRHDPQPVPDNQPRVRVQFPEHPPQGLTAWQGFGLGALLGLLVLAGGWLLCYKPLQQQLQAITDHPAGARLAWLYQPELTSYTRQLEQLAETSPRATWETARRLTATAEQQWPQSPVQQQATRHWQQQVAAQIDSVPLTGSWHATRDQLQQLADKILLQERTRGSFTLSYLKTAIYDIQRSHGSDVPLEEQLRQLSVYAAKGERAPPVLLKGIDDRFNALLGRYDRLRQATEQRASHHTQAADHPAKDQTPAVTQDGGH